MKTEKEKMLSGELYVAADPELTRERLQARKLLYAFNHSQPDDSQLRQRLLTELLGSVGESFWIEPPFYCDYGYNIRAGKNVYFNFNCVALDVCPITIGDHVLFGPAVQIYTATHPVDSQARAAGPELGSAITIADHVWVGGGAILCPGVTIGEHSIIAAGAVITRDVPAGVMIGGNPARIIREVK